MSEERVETKPGRDELIQWVKIRGKTSLQIVLTRRSVVLRAKLAKSRHVYLFITGPQGETILKVKR